MDWPYETTHLRRQLTTSMQKRDFPSWEASFLFVLKQNKSPLYMDEVMRSA